MEENKMTICESTRRIILNKKEMAAARRVGTPKYKELQTARRDYPGFAVTTKASKVNQRETYKGLTYEYMETYIKAHDNDQHSIMAQYEMLRGTSKEAKEALAEPCSYNEVKAWFLNTYPAIANFHKMREELVSAA